MDIKSVLKGKRTRIWLAGLLLVLIVLFVLPRVIFASSNNTTAASTTRVVSVNVAQTIETTGTLEAQPFASLTWNTSGVVEEVYVNAGDQVKAGDVLMKLKKNSVPSSVLSAQADLATAQKDLDSLLSSSSTDLAQAVIDLRDAKQAYDRAVSYLEFLERSKTTRQVQVKMFIESVNRGGKRYQFKIKEFKGPASEDWITEAQNDVALKKAKLEDAQRAYDRLKDGPNAQDITIAQTKIEAAQAKVDTMSILAPFDGEVLYVASQPDDVVTTDSVALNMANLDHLYIETQVQEADIANVKVGDPSAATLNTASEVKLTGKVAAISALGEVESDSVQYTIRIDVDPVAKDVFLPLGSTVNATIQVKPASPSLAVPITVIQNDSKGEYVLVVQANGSTKRVDVASGMIVGDLVTVTGDLKEGDALATSPTNNNMPRPGGGFGRGPG